MLPMMMWVILGGFSFEVDWLNLVMSKVYQRTAQPLVEYIFTGGKATCFAYGQTGRGVFRDVYFLKKFNYWDKKGSGKTFTMLNEQNGLYVKAGRDIFTLLKRPENAHLAAWVSFYEIYQGHLYDLLNNRQRLHAREDGKQRVCIAGLREHEASEVSQLMQIFEFGNNARSTGGELYWGLL
jgi:hypothetical protein